MSLIKIILSELSVICSSCTENDKIHIFNSVVLEYSRLSKFVVNINDIDTFVYLTEWISSQIKKVEKVINIDLLYNYSIEPIINFKSDLTTIGSSSICNFFNTIIEPIKEMIRLNYNGNII